MPVSFPPRLLSVPAGAPFAPTFARAFLGGDVVPNFPDASDPFSSGSATIFVPTRRAGLAIERALAQAAGRGAVVLPTIRPLGSLEGSEADDPETASDAHTVGDLTRRLTLSVMVRAWLGALKGTSTPAAIDPMPSHAFALAGELAALIDDMTIEQVSWQRLHGLAPEVFDDYWRVTVDFLKIAAARWPEWLAEKGLLDRAESTRRLVRREVDRLARGVSGPVIVAGSTGANRATADLIAAVARHPLGAAVLPDLDHGLDEVAWAMIGAEDHLAQGGAGHPQAVLQRLLSDLRVTRSDVRKIGAVAPDLAARGAFLSEAMRPADTTDLWRRREAALAPANLALALERFAVVEADNETEEALVAATALREALETPDKTAALITPDRATAERVKSELARWNAEVDDSQGETLGRSAAGVFGRLLAAAALDFTPVRLAALFAHPLSRFGRTSEAFARASQALDVGVFRGIAVVGGLDDLGALFAAAWALADDPKAHDAKQRIGLQTRAAAEALLRDVAAAIEPLRHAPDSLRPADLARLHRDAIATAASDENGVDRFAASPGGFDLERIFEEWTGGDAGLTGDLFDYVALFEAITATVVVPPPSATGARLTILGLLEARLLHFDRVVLAGLDEGVWPPAAATDAFLNRPLRAALGLTPPERRIGQTAHDFIAALGAPEAIIVRAAKRARAPTVASRFLRRIDAAAGPDVAAAIRERGSLWLKLARKLDEPQTAPPLGEPLPRPPRELRPRRLSVTRIETLRRDPYSIYAEFVLRIVPLDPRGLEYGPREIGTLVHSALQDYLETATTEGENAETQLLSFAQTRLAPLLADESFRVLRWPRIRGGLRYFLGDDARRRAAAASILIERSGSLELPLASGAKFQLTARADRFDVGAGHEVSLVDYKTGAVPGAKEVEVGFAPQLTLEAAMVERGGFRDLPKARVVSADYVRLGSREGGETRPAVGARGDLRAAIDRHFKGLLILLTQFDDAETPYRSRPFPKFASRFAAYDHLARVKEWSVGESDEPGAEE